ncbi:MAG: phospholipase, partial [Desulfobacterales bacterium]|nr:phospholipase [Desulfobacterales bacterium]
IDFITDRINTVYDGSASKEIERLKGAGIKVITCDLRKLRDSNIIYSPIWRTFIQWFGNSNDAGTVRHPFSTTDGKVTLRSYLSLMNFKANHRKVFVADDHGEMISMITSANPHGGSSTHSNVALLVKGDVWQSIHVAEQAVAHMSGASLSNYNETFKENLDDADATIRILSENQIKKALIEEINDTNSASIIRIAQFYLADRDIIKSLLSASARGVDIKIILDPNKDAFGYEKNGIPNRQAAHELVSKTKERIKIRWYDTHGEQFHSKLFLSEKESRCTVIVGSANLTRRNLDNYNLELDIKVIVQTKSQLAQEIMRYFDRLWNNENGLFTVDFEHYKDDSFLKTLVYRIQEGFGLSTF